LLASTDSCRAAAAAAAGTVSGAPTRAICARIMRGRLSDSASGHGQQPLCLGHVQHHRGVWVMGRGCRRVKD
jgi:hypothetical protein